MSGADSDQKSGPTVITKQTAPSDPIPGDDGSSQPTLKRKRVAVNEDSSGPVINTVSTDSEDSAVPAQTAPASAPAPVPKNTGWPKAPPSPSPNNP
jgi:hypothetical protein